MTDVVAKLWGFCHTLRHEGVDYGDYIEQITYLLFLKMADERDVQLPEHCHWDVLRRESGSPLLDAYTDLLRELGKQHGILGDIFAGSQSRFTSPVSLKKLVSLIDETEWTELAVDVKAEAFEGLLEKAASEGKKGAGQYFTPRLLIDAIVRCVEPDPRQARDYKICDPACGTGGFLVSSYEWLVEATRGGRLDRRTAERVVGDTYFGQDLVARPRRLSLMNLYLHGLVPKIDLGDSIYDPPTTTKYNVVLTNPPFGTRGANQAPARDDFTIATANKQLNFLQHVLTILKPGGRAAVVVPDNCLFADQAGAVFDVLTQDCDVHTVLRLPNGTFSPYSPGTKTNVLFFTKGPPTEEVWVFDSRANIPRVTKRDRPLTAEHFKAFEDAFAQWGRWEQRNESERFRRFGIQEVRDLDFKIDGLRWIKDESFDEFDPNVDPQELLSELISELEATVHDLTAMATVVEAVPADGDEPAA